jgi:type IV pilus assembly protein PilY1
MSSLVSGYCRLGLAAFVSLLVAQGMTPANAAVTDIASEPVIALGSITAKPNLMFILDDSGSMLWDYMPDELGSGNTPNTAIYGYWSPQCNGLAYDPAIVYSPPLNADGTPFPNANFSAARRDGYDSGSTADDLTNRTYYRYATSGTLQPKLGWTYDTSGNVITTTTFYRECFSDIGSNPGAGRFTLVTMTAASPDAQNYANWYSYYKRRYLLMRTAVGRAVKQLDSGYRIGFSRINSKGATEGANFRDAKPFDATQKTNFYSSLYGAPVGGGTPLRGALSKIGRYYAKKLPGQTYDPMEYSCQRNYALLTTDGYWNNGGTGNEDGSYGPYDVNGATVGNRDGTEVRPMFDGSSSIQNAVTPTTTVTNQRSITVVRTRTTSEYTVTETLPNASNDGCGGNNNRRRITTRYLRTAEFKTETTSFPRQTLTSTRTVVTTNGVVTSNTVTNNTVTSTWASPTDRVYDNIPGSFVAQSPTLSCTRDGAGTTTSPTTSSTVTQTLSGPTVTVVDQTGPTVGATTTTTTVTGGTSDTLSDVSQYFYANDLRTAALGNCSSTTIGGAATNVCPNIVPTAGRDQNEAQHMTTFTIGLGLSGTLAYDKNYLTQTAGDFVAITNGTKDWPAPTTTLSGNSGDARNIDDLWHAAVNGRGQYYSALDAAALSEAITGVTNTIKQAEGSGVASSFNTLSFVSGTGNTVYQAGYLTRSWVGELNAYAVDGTTGVIAATPRWSAQALLDAKPAASRNILYRQAPGDSTLRAFTFANLNADGYGANFTNLCSKPVVAGQCAALSVANRTLADNGTNLVDYLRGVNTYNATNTSSPLFRTRANTLGDIINGAPVFVGRPPFTYTDAGYASFAAARASRTPVVYVGANDGMLHAFSAESGEELWAYVPTAVMPNMYRLANSNYATGHQSFVDAEPVVGDIYVGGAWKTILVGGLGAGGKAFYALDITDPNNPKSLWEFTDANLGLSFANPVIAKRADGTWIVAVASGYNNTTGDGRGHLYVLNANTGAKLLDIATTAGSAASPSGLTKINAWVDAATNNTAKRFYGGDLLGNLWRFDIDNLVAPNQAAHLVAQFQTAAGVGQPITTRPELLLVSGSHAAVVVGTGRYLGASDITDGTQQSLYVVKDSLTATGLGVVRTNNSLVRQTLSVSGTSISSSNAAVAWDDQNGWWFDFPTSGERIVTGMALQGSVLTAASTVPSGDACTTGGSSWLYRINITTGQAQPPSPLGRLYSDSVLIVGFTRAKRVDGTSVTYLKRSDGRSDVIEDPPGSAAPPGDPRRSIWRELVN